MSTGPAFEAYLISKKIDSDAFNSAEPGVWTAWKREFEEMHPNSFTVQKLNLINPVRRKYPLRKLPDMKPPETTPVTSPAPAPNKPAKPVMRPRPKMS